MPEQDYIHYEFQRDPSGSLVDTTNDIGAYGEDLWEQRDRPDQLSLSYEPSDHRLSINFKVKGYAPDYDRSEEEKEKIGGATPEKLKKVAHAFYEKMGPADASAVYDMEDGFEYGTRVEFSLKLNDPDFSPVDPKAIKELLAAEKWADPKIDALLATIPSIEEQTALKKAKKSELDAAAALQEKIKAEGTVAYKQTYALKSGATVYSDIHNRIDANTRDHDFVQSVAIDKEINVLEIKFRPGYQRPESAQEDDKLLIESLKSKGLNPVVRHDHESISGGNKILLNYQGVPPTKLREAFSEGLGSNILPAEVVEAMGLQQAHATGAARSHSSWAGAVR